MANEKRLIDANALQFEPDPWGGMNGVLMVGRNSGKTMAMVQAALKRMIDNAPTVDAMEVVVHGKARELDAEEWYCCPWECQECGCLMMVRIETGSFIYPYDDIAPVFCAKCGAKMDGGNEDG